MNSTAAGWGLSTSQSSQWLSKITRLWLLLICILSNRDLNGISMRVFERKKVWFFFKIILSFQNLKWKIFLNFHHFSLVNETHQNHITRWCKFTSLISFRWSFSKFSVNLKTRFYVNFCPHRHVKSARNGIKCLVSFVCLRKTGLHAHFHKFFSSSFAAR